MKHIPALLTDRQIDLRGCEYRESPHLVHMDGFLVYYHQHGQLVLNAHLTDSEKLQGIQRLLSRLGSDGVKQPQIFFWTSGEVRAANSLGPRQAISISRPDTAPESPFTTDSRAEFLTPMPAPDQRVSTISLLRVPRDFLPRAVHTVIDQRPIRRAALEEAHTFVEEETTSGHLVSLDLQTPVGASWLIVARITPPLQGQLLLTFGSHTFRGLVADDGTSVLRGIEPDLLLNANGPDLEICLEPLAAMDDVS